MTSLDKQVGPPPSHGYGIMESIRTCLAEDYDICLKIQDMYQQVATELINDPEHTRYHNVAPDHDSIAANMCSTLTSDDAGKVIVDFYIPAIAAALKLHILVYEEVHERIAVRHFIPRYIHPKYLKKVHLCWEEEKYKPILNLSENCRPPTPMSTSEDESGTLGTSKGDSLQRKITVTQKEDTGPVSSDSDHLVIMEESDIPREGFKEVHDITPKNQRKKKTVRNLAKKLGLTTSREKGDLPDIPPPKKRVRLTKYSKALEEHRGSFTDSSEEEINEAADNNKSNGHDEGRDAPKRSSFKEASARKCLQTNYKEFQDLNLSPSVQGYKDTASTNQSHEDAQQHSTSNDCVILSQEGLVKDTTDMGEHTLQEIKAFMSSTTDISEFGEFNSSQGSNGSSSSEGLKKSKKSANFSRGYHMDMTLFKDTKPLYVEKVPHDIDGKKVYKIKLESEEDKKLWTQKYADGRYFKYNSSTRKGLVGMRKIGKCLSAFKCNNKECAFLKSTGKPNQHQFKTLGSEKFCITCDVLAVPVECKAIKIVEYCVPQEEVTIYHLGQHNCQPKVDNSGEKEFIMQTLKEMPQDCGPRQLAIVKMQHELKRQQQVGNYDLTQFVKIASNLTDTKKIDNAKRELEAQTRTDRQLLSVVGQVKQTLDVQDKYFIYRINDATFNGKVSYVFKSSLVMALLALDMQQGEKENTHPMQEEYTYFDCMHSRCIDWKTFTLWAYHPAPRRLYRLATMECKGETALTVAKFFELWNKILAEVKGDPNFKWNPAGWICDEAGANFNGIAAIYGEEILRKVFGCQFHFKHCLDRLIKRIPAEMPEVRAEAEELAIMMLTVETMPRYHAIVKRFRQLGGLCKSISSWIEWWHARRYHLFPVFRGYNLASMNLAEVGNATLARNKKQYLVDAAWEDYFTMLVQNTEFVNFMQGKGFTHGHGPTQAARAAKERQEQERRGQEYIQQIKEQILDAPNEDYENFVAHMKAKHRAPEMLPRGNVQGRIIHNSQAISPPNSPVKRKPIPAVASIGSSATIGQDKQQLQGFRLVKITNLDGSIKHALYQGDKLVKNVVFKAAKPSTGIPSQEAVPSQSSSQSVKHIQAQVPQSQFKSTKKSTTKSPPKKKEVENEDYPVPQLGNLAAYQEMCKGKPKKNEMPLPPEPQLIQSGLPLVIADYRGSQEGCNDNSATPANIMPLPEQPQQEFRIRPVSDAVKDGNSPLLHILTNKKVTTCYGCKVKFTPSLRTAPKNLILQMMIHKDRPDMHGNWVKSHLKSWGYFHLNINCIRRINTRLEWSDVYLNQETKEKLQVSHIQHLKNQNLLKFFQKAIYGN